MSTRGGLVAAAFLVLPAIGVLRTQPGLAKIVHQVKQRDDVYVLPPPKELRVMTLGYHAATVDLLWAKLLVEYGTHWQEKRPFHATPYLDAILELEPDHELVYKYADTLIAWRPPRGDADDARTARRYLERGLRERPRDYHVWQSYGQFIAFIAPSFLSSAQEIDQWRRDGADALQHAVELGADAERSRAAASILSRAGAYEAGLTYLRRAWVVVDDAEERKRIDEQIRLLEAKVQNAQGEATNDAYRRVIQTIEARWHHEYPFLTYEQFLLVGPAVDPAMCAGPASKSDSSNSIRCARSWTDAVTDVVGAQER